MSFKNFEHFCYFLAHVSWLECQHLDFMFFINVSVARADFLNCFYKMNREIIFSSL